MKTATSPRSTPTTPTISPSRSSQSRLVFWGRLKADCRRNKAIYLMMLPVLLWFIIFCYVPMYGAQIAFKDFQPKLGIMGSEWVGFKHFVDFFSSVFAWRVIRNTLVINLLNLMFAFPAAILLALLLNEVRCNWFKRSIQTISYLPHFVSTVVICGIILNFCSTEGLFSQLLAPFGVQQQNWMMNPSFFKPMYIVTDIWQGIGWGSIIYLAALSGISPELYEAARIDGAGRLRQTWNVTIPGILPTIMTMLILRVGQMMSLGFEKIILLYQPSIYDTADVISSFVYRKGIQEMAYSYSTAVGLFNSVINLVLVIAANYLSKKYTDNSLW